MAPQSLFIKNMVCPRCIMAVKAVLEECGIVPDSVLLGEVHITQPITGEQRSQLSDALQAIGFELLSDPKQQLVERIRTLIIDWVNKGNSGLKLSVFLKENINKEYSVLSKLFTEVKGITIEQYMKLIRIERVKEELCYGDKSISELSFIYGFSSPAHLSAQFRSVTGMSPKQFQQLENGDSGKKRTSLDKI